MSWIDFVHWLLSASGAGGFLLAWRVHKNQRRDKKWEERMKATIRKQVEKELKSHEAKLRVSADLQLSVHEKAWTLLRDVVGAASDIHKKLEAFIVLHQMHADAKTLTEIGTAAAHTFVRFEMLAAIAPPEYELKGMVLRYRSLHGILSSLWLFDPKLTDEKKRVESYSLAHSELRQTREAMDKIADAWNAKLWKATEVLLGEASPTRAIAPRPLMGDAAPRALPTPPA